MKAEKQSKKSQKQGGEKTCFMTKETANRSELLRFVVSPDHVVCFDVSQKLPGRGVWMKPDRKMLEKAIQKKLFSKAFKEAVQIPADLCEETERLLRQKCLDLMGLVRKSGRLVFGFEAVKKALSVEKPVLLLEASDAAENGQNKLLRPQDDFMICSCFSREELGRISGQDIQVHVAVFSGKISEELKKTILKLTAFINSKEK